MPGVASPAVVDHSPQNPHPAAPLETASNLVLIDNYDSFTWNVYQYLVLAGASVTVFRNDETTLDHLIQLGPTQLVVSPGPGHPSTDAGISCEAIKHFSGKIPVLGVCMGEQCIFSVFGGKVEVTGEILHGKTSPLAHDGKGVYKGLSQNVLVTRYHSLAGTHATLPECLEVSSWISGGPDGDKGIIMGVRHREYIVEGVQFHPESILTEEGMLMLKNFLSMQGGTWKENNHIAVRNEGPTHKSPTGKPRSEAGKTNILDEIFAHRRQVVEQQKATPSSTPFDLEQDLKDDIAPPVISFVDRLRQSPYPLSLLAEIKRASPSKGDISMTARVSTQARQYALAGASAISVLTEPARFKGTIDDLRRARQSVNGMRNRPAILRKDFIFDRYQILEARLAGADTVLLIVKMLDNALLTDLYHYSQSLGMEPLVEVNTAEEMQIAVRLGAHVIGVNNRDLTNFKVDLGTTSRLMETVPKTTMVLALSGIAGPQDVQAYKREGVKGVLVGEALMRAHNVASFVSELLGGSDEPGEASPERPLVKICGNRTPEAVKVAVEAGADMVGIILVTGRSRCVDTATALAISDVVHSSPARVASSTRDASAKAIGFFEHSAATLRQAGRPLLVGVFQNQPLSYILLQQALLRLDVVQLHGSEPLEWASLIPVPVIRRFGPEDISMATSGYHKMPLVDTAAGGTGTSIDGGALKRRLDADAGLRVILAGGLTPDNVAQKLAELQNAQGGIVGVDVSSGVEQNGVQSHDLIRRFVAAVKGGGMNGGTSRGANGM